MAASDSPTTQSSQLVFLFFAFAPPRAFSFDQKLSRNVAQIILYYHVTKQFLPCLNWLVTCFQFQSMFSKNISCFRFWWKTYAKRCTSNNYVKRLSSPALCGWSGWCFQFQGMIWKTKECRKQKYCIKNMAVKIPILVLLRFCLLWWLKSYLFCVLSLL